MKNKYFATEYIFSLDNDGARFLLFEKQKQITGDSIVSQVSRNIKNMTKFDYLQDDFMAGEKSAIY